MRTEQRAMMESKTNTEENIWFRGRERYYLKAYRILLQLEVHVIPVCNVVQAHR